MFLLQQHFFLMPKLYYHGNNDYDYCEGVFKAERQSLSSEDLSFLLPERFFFCSLIFLVLDIVW